MKILVPIDLTNASLCGFKYAERLNHALKGKLIALNIIPSGQVSPDQKEERNQELEIRLKKLIRMTREYPDLCDHKMVEFQDTKYEVDFGTVVGNILKYVKKNKVDLVILGTRAKHNAIEYIFGSLSTELIRKIKIPVIIIPEGTTYQKIKNITLGIDLKTYPLQKQKFINQFASNLKATISPVYVKKIFDNKNINVEKHTTVQTEYGTDKKKRDVVIINNPSVVKGLDHYIEEHNSDMIALKIPIRNKAEDILTRSLSKELVFATKVPLLIVH